MAATNEISANTEGGNMEMGSTDTEGWPQQNWWHTHWWRQNMTLVCTLTVTTTENAKWQVDWMVCFLGPKKHMHQSVQLHLYHTGDKVIITTATTTLRTTSANETGIKWVVRWLASAQWFLVGCDDDDHHIDRGGHILCGLWLLCNKDQWQWQIVVVSPATTWVNSSIQDTYRMYNMLSLFVPIQMMMN